MIDHLVYKIKVGKMKTISTLGMVVLPSQCLGNCNYASSFVAQSLQIWGTFACIKDAVQLSAST